MSNLLDKASILLSPNAYNNGSMLSVKPTDGDGDFTFVRGSAATRVNAQGLVENVQIISSELVTNGNFSQEGTEEITNGDFTTDTKWSKGNGWSISGGSANCDGTQTSNTELKQQGGVLGATINFVVGKTYKVNFDIVVTSGAITYVEVASGLDNNNVNTSGNHTTYITAVSTNNRFTIAANPDFIGSIDNVSVKEVGQDWNIEAVWTIGDGVANGNGANGTSEELTQSNVVTIGKTYSISYEIKNYVSGVIRIRKPQTINRNANGTYTETVTTTSEAFIFSPSDFIGSITNVSVKEVTDDTNLPRINYEGFSYDGNGDIIPDSGCGSWLLERQSTNLYLNSGDASQWNFGGNGFPNNTTRVDNQSSPDGETNASLFSRDTGTSGWFGSNTNATNSETYTHSVFVKKGTSSTVEIRNVNNNPQSSITYNIDTNTITVENNATGKSVNYGNGWYRVEMTFEYTNAAGTTSQIRHTLEDGKSMSVFGAQSEEQSFATSYIPTEGATNTRNQDIATNSGNATLINSTEGTLYAEIDTLADGVNGRYISIGDGSLSNYVYIRITGNLNEIKMGVIKGGSTKASKSFTVPNLKQSNKLAVSYQQDLFRFYVNGTLIFTDTNGDIFPAGTLNALTFNLANTNNYFNGKNKCVAVYKEALTSAELQSLTTI